MARHDEIRVGDAERDAVMVALHDHFAAGRLDRGELDERLDTALTAKTRGDLRTLVEDLPAPTGLPEPEKGAGPGAPLAFPGLLQQFDRGWVAAGRTAAARRPRRPRRACRACRE
ncbi:DUF1707 SHOCT-like domain-containing protein, partial [Actinomadura geliboluensis]